MHETSIPDERHHASRKTDENVEKFYNVHVYVYQIKGTWIFTDIRSVEIQ